MSLFWQEVKKIWRPGVLMALALLGLLYYDLFPSYYIEYFCSGPTARAEFDLALGWQERYGPTMEPEERAGLDGQLAAERRAFAVRLAEIPEAAAAGLRSYAAFEAAWQAHYAAQGERADMEAERFFNLIMNNSNYYRIKALENYLDNYDWHARTPWGETAAFAALGPDRQARVLELERGGRGFLPDGVVGSTTEYAKSLAVWLVLSTVLLLSPTLVRDRLHRLRQSQWASRRGRRVLRVQFAAGLCSALALTALDLLLYALPFLAQGPLALAACPLFNWSLSEYYWFGGSYGQYLGLLLLLLLALGLAAGALTLFLSQYSGNYVAMLLKALPLFLALGPGLGVWLLDRPFRFRSLFETAALPLPRGTEALCAAVLLLAALALLARACRRQRRRELTD